MDADLIDRLNSLMSHYGLSQSQFAQRIGVKQPNLSAIISGDRPCGTGVINKILLSFDINKDWLLTGEGEMLKSDNETSGTARDEFKSNFKEREYHLVPLVNIDSVGGVHSQNAIVPSEQYTISMIPFTEAQEGDIAIIQSGSSMTPTIPPGSILLLREVPEWREYFGYGNIFVLWLKDGRRITKEIRRYDNDAKNFVWCVSHNPEVADEELPKSFIKGVWKVIKFQADFGW